MATKFNELIQSEKPVLVDFTATWCGPCKMMAPILQQVKDQLKDEVTIVKIDIDRNPEITQHFSIQGVPTLMIFHKGDLKWRQSGVIPANNLVQLLHQYGS
ncbi:MAG: thioredoxin [Bacteroidetes bacterium]|nr:thioredoxin [Bacteroidota bacterium]